MRLNHKTCCLDHSLLSVFKPAVPNSSTPAEVKAEWQSPSNIALVKYWGKKEEQLPSNPSISMTLSKAATRTEILAIEKAGQENRLKVNGDPGHPFAQKPEKLIQWLQKELPVLERYSFHVTTSNSFPHSAGIASSASGISAFTLCLLSIISEITGKRIPADAFLQTASFISRMGSGSACRSVYGGFSLWGETPALPGSSDLYAVPLNDRMHPECFRLHDAILVVSSSPKSLSSSLGHELMNAHPFSGARSEQAVKHVREMLDAMRSGDIDKIAIITENEALTLHSLIMTSPGGPILMKPGTLLVIRRIQQARRRGLPVFFSLDAGPNVHLLYPDRETDTVEKFIREELVQFCENGRVIFDHCGEGPAMSRNELRPAP